MRSYYRRWVNRTSHLKQASRKKAYKSKNFIAIEEEINKKIPNFPWMPSKNKIVPKIKRTVQTTKAGTKCFSYRFNITFNGETKTYARKDSKLLEEMRSKVMEAGHHIDFPKPPPPNKGIDNWRKKAEAKKEENKGYWEKHGWDESKIKILRDNFKTKTDKELSKTLLKTHTSKAIAAKRESLGLLKK